MILFINGLNQKKATIKILLFFILMPKKGIFFIHIYFVFLFYEMLLGI